MCVRLPRATMEERAQMPRAPLWALPVPALPVSSQHYYFPSCIIDVTHWYSTKTPTK